VKFHPLSELFPLMQGREFAKAERIAESGAVYAIRDDERRAVKLGWSTDPLRRLTQLQTAVPHALRIVAVIAGGKTLERGLQSIFKDRRIRGEWFSDHDNEVSAVMAELSARGY
jgi:hypothetical protein